MRFIEKWRYKLGGKIVPVIKCEDVDISGRVQTIRIFQGGRRSNSILNFWDGKGWDINKDFGTVRLINEKEVEQQAYIVTEHGDTGGLWTRMSAFPNYEDIIGNGATLDDIADAMNFHKSLKWIAIGALCGGPIWFLITTVLLGMAK